MTIDMMPVSMDMRNLVIHVSLMSLLDCYVQHSEALIDNAALKLCSGSPQSPTLVKRTQKRRPSVGGRQDMINLRLMIEFASIGVIFGVHTILGKIPLSRSALQIGAAAVDR